jgi:hypothetical protein
VGSLVVNKDLDGASVSVCTCVRPFTCVSRKQRKTRPSGKPRGPVSAETSKRALTVIVPGQASQSP